MILYDSVKQCKQCYFYFRVRRGFPNGFGDRPTKRFIAKKKKKKTIITFLFCDASQVIK
jgi:hypothetical protein